MEGTLTNLRSQYKSYSLYQWNFFRQSQRLQFQIRVEGAIAESMSQDFIVSHEAL